MGSHLLAALISRKAMANRRTKKKKSFQHVIKVFCDGITEKEYVEAIRQVLKQQNITLDVSPKLGKADKFKDVFKTMEELLDDKESSQYLKIFYITDMDTIEKQGKIEVYKQTKQRCLNANKASGRVFIIENKPCFEFWLLLHYKRLTKPFSNCDEVIKELKKYWPEYDKSLKCAKQVFDKLKDRLDTAKNNSRLSYKGRSKSHSYSEMHIFYKEIEKKLKP